MQVQPTYRLSVMRVAAAGAASAAIFYAFCWLGAFLPVGPATHAYLALFTSADLTSVSALIQGICWSLAFGLVAGGLFALFYNAFRVLDRA